MTVQPKYHWQFNERQGTTAVDDVSGVQATLSKAEFNGHGRIGNAIHLLKRDSHVNLGKEVGQFGTSDFTVAFGLKIMGTDGQNDLDIIGTRSMSGHGNCFSLRLQDKGRRLTFEVDENSKGKNYAVAKTPRLSNLFDKKWHHITLVREGRTIGVYLDGVLVAEGASKTGVANINRAVDVKLGHYTRHTPIAHYEDLRIYHKALTTEEVRDLIPPINRPLSAGEIELVATDNTAVILTQNDADLSRFSSNFKELRIGDNTGVTLYQQNSFRGTAQKCYADLPDIRLSRLENFPKSIRIWRAIEEPFTGKWVIKAPKGQFLSLSKSVLSTSPRRSFHELFKFHYNLQRNQLQLIPGSDRESTLVKVSPGEDSTHLFVDDLEPLKDEFSITNQANNQWLALVENNTFDWTGQKEDRAIFIRVAKMAENEGQVGELAPGEVALYKHRAYYGRTWILSDSDKYTSGKYTHLKDFHDLNDQTSSIRLGPDTGVTVFRNLDHQAADDKREEEIEDIVENVPRLSDRQIGNDTISSIQIFRTISPEDVFTSYTTKLSQDYRLVDNKMEEFSAYRTTLRFEPGAGAVEVAATDLTTIEVAGTTYEIDEVRSVTLSPNDLNFIMITSEADGLNTPGLKIRTSEMTENEQVVIFPNQEAHQQIAELEDDALWNATDAQGNLIVDRTAHSQAEVASVQNTIKRVTATVTYTDAVPAANPNGGSRVRSSEQVVSGATIDQPWELKLTPTPDNNAGQQAAARTATLPVQGLASVSAPGSSPGNVGIQEAAISQDDFMRLLTQAIPEETAPAQPPVGNLPDQGSFLRIGKPFKGVGDAVKKATSVVVGAAEDVVHVIVKTADGVTDFVIDTAEKVAEFVEAVVEKVVESIKKFIEFLQFLFGWDDILDTQRYLASTINAVFDYAAQLAEDAKPHVSAFVNNLQDTVEDSMNTLVEKLGSDPSEVRESGFKLPEAVEWFLAKLFGGSKQSDTDTVPDSATNSSGDSPLEEFMKHFLEAIEDVAGAGLRGLEGVGESIAELIKNPLKPQRALIVIIEALRDAVIQLLDGAENIALGLLEVVEAAVKLFQKLLNSEIKIPFISDLFELIGAGKLTILNLATVLLAVPVTVVHKIAFNERPFKDVPPLDFSTQPETDLAAAVSQRALVGGQPENPEETSESSKPSNKELVIGLGTTALVASGLNGLLNAFLDAVPEALDGPREKSYFMGGLEAITLVTDVFIWLPTIPGLLKEGDFKDAEPLEKALWIVRTVTLGLDLIVTAYGWLPIIGIDINTQRMRRADERTIIVFVVISVMDLFLASAFVGELEDKQGLNLINQVLFKLPGIAGWLRLVDDQPEPSLLLSLIDVTTGFAAIIPGGLLLANDVAALEEAMQAA